MGKKRQKQLYTELTYTQVIPVVQCSDVDQLRLIMDLCGVVRAATYNKLGSLQGWGLAWQKAGPIIRNITTPELLSIPAKIFEWSVNDCFKAITAQQEAAKSFIIRKIWQKIPLTQNERDRVNGIEQYKRSSPKIKASDLKAMGVEQFPKVKEELARDNLFQLLYTDPTKDNWLHRQFRSQYIKGHTYIRNQVVYQGQGYKATRIKRNLIKLEVQGLERGKKIQLLVRSNRMPQGQIRVIDGEQGLEIHTAFKREVVASDVKAANMPQLGMDKGYTEGFYTSLGVVIANGLGQLMTQKTERITKVNRNRQRFFALARNSNDPEKQARIQQNNLGRQVQNGKLRKDKQEIRNLIRRDLRKNITEPTAFFVEDLSSPIKGKVHAVRINRQLNSWMKGELQNSVESIALETGSIVKTVNPAYTSQVDHLTGTLLGVRNGDRFTRYTGDVLQADYNAAKNILHRGTDAELSRYMRKEQVESVLMNRTVRYLHLIGHSVQEALDLGWLNSKFKRLALETECRYLQQG